MRPAGRPGRPMIRARTACSQPRVPWVWLALACLLASLSAVTAARSALVRPWGGAGDFNAVLDVLERPREDGTSNLVLLVSVPNAELVFQEEWGGGYKGKLRCRAVVGDGERRVERAIELDLVARSRDDASAQTAYQVFTLTLPDVEFDLGRLRCVLHDLEAGRRLRLEDENAENPRCVIEGEWYRDASRGEAHGLWLGAPLFLSGAPRQELAADRHEELRPEQTLLGEFLHPNRRYGVEQDILQVVFDAETLGLTRENATHLPRRLLMQVLSRELDMAVRDTIDLGLDPVSFVSRGGLARIDWEFDVNRLPPGTYQLSCAPLDGFGNAWVTEFDVFWSMQSFARSSDEQFLIGSMVLLGERREAFFAADTAGREAILARFWDEHDPDPATSGSEALVEFRRRMLYVDRFLGGFGRSGPVDDRGLIYIMFGEPDEVQMEVVPLNSRGFMDAIDRVYDKFLEEHHGDVLRDEYASDEQTIQSVRARLNRKTSIESFKSYELWIYNDNGRQLFPNHFTDMPLGVRFLFLARLGGGSYHLEVTNAWDKGMPGK